MFILHFPTRADRILPLDPQEAMDPTLALTCAESIAFLSILHMAPEEPFANPIPDSQLQQSEGHLLPFEKERHLASTLAFLSCTKRDPNRIPALYVRENQQAMKLEVVLAVNAENHLSGIETRDTIKASLQSILGALAVSLQGKSSSSSSSSYFCRLK